MTINLPDNVSYIIGTLANDGCEAYAVGGCVRDSILGRTPGDWDITTSALPEHTRALFRRTVDTGIKHGTVTVMIGSTGYEVTTYRIDGKYTDSRHPDSVSFTRSLEEDLKRRDFTINAMAYSDKAPEDKRLVDLFGGVSDLRSRIIRCVGDPYARFNEDALRILRAFRFSAQLDFRIEPETYAAACSLAHTLVRVSAERIHAELDKLLLSDHPGRILELHAAGIDPFIFPELRTLFEQGDELPRRVAALLDASPADLIIRWAILLLHTGSSRAVLRNLRSDNRTIGLVTMLTANAHSISTDPSPLDIRRLAGRIGIDSLPLLFTFVRALGTDSDVAGAERILQGIIERGEATSIKELAVNGSDLLALGLAEGKPVGDALEYLLGEVIREPSLNSCDRLLSIAAERYC